MSRLTSWLASPPPDAAMEIGADAVSGATVGSRGTETVVEAFAFEPLPGGALAPSLAAQNIADRAAVAAALQTVVSRLGSRPRRVALVVPDTAARVSLIEFDQVPAGRNDLDQLVRWQMRKSAPFPDRRGLRDLRARSLHRRRRPGVRGRDGPARRRPGVRGASASRPACTRASSTLSSFSLVNCFLAAGRVPTGDWLVVHMRPDYTSIAHHARRRRDLLPQPARRGRRPVHRPRAPDDDVLPGPAVRRRVFAGAGRWDGAHGHRRRERAPRVSKNASARRSSRSIRPDWRSCRIASGSLRSTWAVWPRSSACCCGPGMLPRPPDAAHQPLDPPVLQRRAPCARSSWAWPRSWPWPVSTTGSSWSG